MNGFCIQSFKIAGISLIHIWLAFECGLEKEESDFLFLEYLKFSQNTVILNKMDSYLMHCSKVANYEEVTMEGSQLIEESHCVLKQ